MYIYIYMYIYTYTYVSVYIYIYIYIYILSVALVRGSSPKCTPQGARRRSGRSDELVSPIIVYYQVNTRPES